MRREVTTDACAHDGIRMNWTHDADVGFPRQQVEDRGADDVEAASVVLAAMQCQGNEARCIREESKRRAEPVFDLLAQQIDDGVADQMDALGSDAFTAQVGCRGEGRRKVQRRKAGDTAAEILFGERPQRMIGTQACLDVCQWQVEIARGECCGVRGARIALGDQHRRCAIARRVPNLCAQASQRRGQSRGVACGQFDVARLTEVRERLCDHGRMLATVHDDGRTIAAPTQCSRQAREFQTFGTGAGHEKNPRRGVAWTH